MVVGHYRMEEIISFFRNLWHSSWTGLKAKTRRAEEQSNDQVGSRWATCGGEGGEIFAIGSTIIIVIVTTTTTTTTASYFCCLARESRPRDLCGASILGVFRLLSFFFFLCCLPCIGSGLPVSFGVRLDRKLLPKIYEPDLMRHTQKYIDLLVGHSLPLPLAGARERQHIDSDGYSDL